MELPLAVSVVLVVAGVTVALAVVACLIDRGGAARHERKDGDKA